MTLYVLLQISCLRKRNFTLVTGIWLLPCMSFLSCAPSDFLAEKTFLNIGHRNMASPLYEFVCAPSDFLPEKKIFHIGHRNMDSPLYVFLCAPSDVLPKKKIFHISHRNMSYPLYEVLCAFSDLLNEKKIFTLVTGIWLLSHMSSYVLLLIS
jgi:hypothetical protein